MPRVCSSTNEPLDFCVKHFPSEGVAEDRFGNDGSGPDGRGNCFAYNAEHPPYEGDSYKCMICKRLLTEEDN